MHRGFIKIWRCLKDWDWFDDHVTFSCFIKMVMMANYKDERWRGIVIPRGSFVSSLSSLSKSLCLSIRQTRTVIDRLKSTGEMTSKSTSKYTIYIVVNYDKFQSIEDKSTIKATSQRANERQASDKRATLTKEVKERKEVKEEKNIKVFSEDSLEIRLTNLLVNLIKKRDDKFKQPNQQKWAKHIDLLLRVDKRSVADVEKVIRWCQQDSFWQNNILSTNKLRMKFQQLWLKSSEASSSKPSHKEDMDFIANLNLGGL